MKLRLGINTCFAVKRWPRPADWAPIVAGSLGLRLVQHSLDLVDLSVHAVGQARQAAAIAEAAAAHDLEVTSTFTGLAAYSANLLLGPDAEERGTALVWYRSVIAFSGRLGCAATGGHVGALSVGDATDPLLLAARWRDLEDALEALAVDAAAAGLTTFVVENLASPREPSTMSQIESLLRPAQPGRAAIALCLDVGHMCVPGTGGDDRDPEAWLRRLGRLAPMIQLQQSDAAGDHHWPFTPERNREGRIEADRVIDSLGEGGVDAAELLLEVIPPFEQADDEVLEDLRASVDYWRAALDRRGVLAAD
jgi:D-erythrulose 1-phosphate 3-epimerase